MGQKLRGKKEEKLAKGKRRVHDGWNVSKRGGGGDGVQSGHSGEVK